MNPVDHTANTLPSNGALMAFNHNHPLLSSSSQSGLSPVLASQTMLTTDIQTNNTHLQNTNNHGLSPSSLSRTHHNTNEILIPSNISLILEKILLKTEHSIEKNELLCSKLELISQTQRELCLRQETMEKNYNILLLEKSKNEKDINRFNDQLNEISKIVTQTGRRIETTSNLVPKSRNNSGFSSYVSSGNGSSSTGNSNAPNTTSDNNNLAHLNNLAKNLNDLLIKKYSLSNGNVMPTDQEINNPLINMIEKFENHLQAISLGGTQQNRVINEQTKVLNKISQDILPAMKNREKIILGSCRAMREDIGKIYAILRGDKDGGNLQQQNVEEANANQAGLVNVKNLVTINGKKITMAHEDSNPSPPIEKKLKLEQTPQSLFQNSKPSPNSLDTVYNNQHHMAPFQSVNQNNLLLNSANPTHFSSPSHVQAQTQTQLQTYQPADPRTYSNTSQTQHVHRQHYDTLKFLIDHFTEHGDENCALRNIDLRNPEVQEGIDKLVVNARIPKNAPYRSIAASIFQYYKNPEESKPFLRGDIIASQMPKETQQQLKMNLMQFVACFRPAVKKHVIDGMNDLEDLTSNACWKLLVDRARDKQRSGPKIKANFLAKQLRIFDSSAQNAGIMPYNMITPSNPAQKSPLPPCPTSEILSAKNLSDLLKNTHPTSPIDLPFLSKSPNLQHLSNDKNDPDNIFNKINNAMNQNVQEIENNNNNPNLNQVLTNVLTSSNNSKSSVIERSHSPGTINISSNSTIHGSPLRIVEENDNSVNNNNMPAFDLVKELEALQNKCVSNNNNDEKVE